MEYEQKVRKKVWEIFGNSKKVTTFALAIEREIIDAKDGPFVYRLGRKIFILERGVRFPQGLPAKTSNQKKMIARFSLSEGGGGSSSLLYSNTPSRYIWLSLKTWGN